MSWAANKLLSGFSLIRSSFSILSPSSVDDSHQCPASHHLNEWKVPDQKKPNSPVINPRIFTLNSNHSLRLLRFNNILVIAMWAILIRFLILRHVLSECFLALKKGEALAEKSRSYHAGEGEGEYEAGGQTFLHRKAISMAFRNG